MTSTAKGAIIGGCVGIVVMFVIIESGESDPGLVAVLWPSSLMGIDDHGQGGIFQLVAGSIEVALQFLTYAVLGGAIGFVVRMIRGEG